jgi:hypothetical protein
MAEYIAETEFFEWICNCGNLPEDDGFYTVNSKNQLVEPTYKAWDSNNYCCLRCGRIIDVDSLQVVDIASQEDLLADYARLYL